MSELHAYSRDDSGLPWFSILSASILKRIV